MTRRQKLHKRAGGGGGRGRRVAAVLLLGLGAALLLVPTGTCGSALSARTAAQRPLPAGIPPTIDAAQASADRAAVAAAQAAFAAATPGPRLPTTTTRTVAPDAGRVAAAQSAVSRAQRDVDAAQAEVNRLEAEQQASSDPASYDSSVAAARETLDQDQAVLEDAQRALALARATHSVAVTTTPRPAVAPDRRALLATLTAAKQTQAAHLVAGRSAEDAWRAHQRSLAAAVTAHNAHVRLCASQAGVPATAGVACLLTGAVVAVWTRPRRRAGKGAT